MECDFKLVMLFCVLLASGSGCESSEPQVESRETPSLAKEDAVQPPRASDEVEVDAKPPKTERIRDEAVQQAAAEEPAPESAPQPRTAFFRLDMSGPASIPPVVLSKDHAALCKVKVGDALPVIELSAIGIDEPKKLTELSGSKATVVVFWNGQQRMSREAIADLGPDVLELFGDRGVNVVGLAVNTTSTDAAAALQKAGAKFPNLLDADGKTFAQIGTGRLPRIFLVDPAGKVLWFDIEYSQTTRRELHRALHAVTGAPPETPATSSPSAGKSAE